MHSPPFGFTIQNWASSLVVILKEKIGLFVFQWKNSHILSLNKAAGVGSGLVQNSKTGWRFHSFSRFLPDPKSRTLMGYLLLSQQFFTICIFCIFITCSWLHYCVNIQFCPTQLFFLAHFLDKLSLHIALCIQNYIFVSFHLFANFPF